MGEAHGRKGARRDEHEKSGRSDAADEQLGEVTDKGRVLQSGAEIARILSDPNVFALMGDEPVDPFGEEFMGHDDEFRDPFGELTGPDGNPWDFDDELTGPDGKPWDFDTDTP
jgi:hypothetical protein